MKKIICLICMSVSLGAAAQTELYPQHFNLEEVTLLDSPLKTAMDKNFQTLLSYDVDRLLNPYIRQAGLNEVAGTYYQWSSSHPSFANWGSSDFTLDGHVGGHYLSAVSLAYAACHDDETKAALKAKVDYMVGVMQDCQDVYDSDETGLRGFIGGQPMNEAWQKLYSESNTALRGTGSCAVPWYCQHKILAGLRDAYMYGGNSDARTVFLKLCDWCILVTSNLTDEQMESMLNTEHGGVNESLLDAYQLTGEEKYLTAAKRFTHKTMLNGMSTFSSTFLDNKHANTQVPKYIGMERIGEQDATATAYQNAAENFWTDVAENRTVCIGGNSVAEHFLTVASSNRYIDHLDGPESCNTNNMMKLSEMLSDRTHDAKYVDFYEYAMWNHILSTQDPATGGYVYFTTLRPQAYRIYSTVNEGMWCCVGTGMENHSKYGHFIYTHDGTSKLYVNLFTASSLSSNNFVISQATSFPFEAQTTLTVGTAGTYTIAIRHPWWTTSGYKIYINNVEQSISVTAGTASYVELNRTWANGDVIRVELPMELRYTPCPNYTDYIAFQYGPILLAAQTSANDADEAASKHLTYEASLQNEYGREGRMDHAPGSRASSKTLTSAPLLIGSRDGENGVLSKITTNNLSTLTFTLDASRENAEDYTWQTLTLQPFYQIHHARYSCYWYQQTAENFANSTMAAEEAAKAALKERTLDFVATGEQQSEAGHFTSYENSTTGSYNDEYYRDARAGGYVQYTLSYEGEAIASGLSILCRFTQADANRKSTLYVDDVKIADITSVGAFNGSVVNGFYNVEYPIPAHLMRDAENNVKQGFTVRLAADKGTAIPGLYYLRLMKEYDAGMPATVTTMAGDERTVIDYIDTGDNGQSEMSHSLGWSGSNSGSNHGYYNNRYWRTGLVGEYFCYDLQTNGETDGVSLVVDYYGNDNDRLSSIDIDGVTIATDKIHYMRSGYIVVEYPIDPILLEGKKSINVKFSSIGGKYTCSANYVYLTTGRSTVTRAKTAYIFVPENFEKNGNDGNISSMTYNDGAIQIASGGGDRSINMRMKTSVKDTYSILPNQNMLLVKGQKLSTTAALWWLMGCNHGASDPPTYTLTDGDDIYLVWDLRKVATFNDAEKNARFFGVGEVAVTTSNGGAYSLMCMGLTSSADDHSAIISDIGFYSPEQLVDKYDVLKSTVSSMATGLTTGSQFAYDGYIYNVTSATAAEVIEALSTGGALTEAPATVFGYDVLRSVVEVNRQIIIDAKGNATSLITNNNFETAGNTATEAEGWSGGTRKYDIWTWRNGRCDYENTSSADAVFTQTLSDMPAGRYKVVAAVRGAEGTTATAQLTDGTTSASGTTITNGDFSEARQQINLKGVQMPYGGNYGGFGTGVARGWQWATATYDLSADGDLTINFLMNGTGWRGVSDVNLYYMSDNNGTDYAVDYTDGVDAANHAVVCDFQTDNPNKLFTSTAALVNAHNEQPNNNLVSGTVANLVLYDGYAFTADEEFTATAATLYRKINVGSDPAYTFATICAPFAISSGATGTFYQPESLNAEGLLTFATESTPEAGKPYLLKATANVNALTGSGIVKVSPIDNGSGVAMKGTFGNIAAVPTDDYVLSGANLYRVNSTVTLSPFRAYFTVSDPAAVKANVLSLNFDGETTAIDEIVNSTSTNSTWYDLSGRRVNSPKRGLYIVNGKKVIIK